MNRLIAELIMLISDMNQQFARRGDFGVILREKDSRAGVLLNNRGSLDALAACERFSSEYRTINRIPVEKDLASSNQRGTCLARGCGQRSDGVGSDGDKVGVHDLQRDVRLVISETRLMELVKCVSDGYRVILRIARGLDRNGQ